ncbi:MAG: D-galactonate dehydratase family protein [Saprospiraceae bacterium]|nr:D-galactonate dehydratase family protein [Saprospiraceae bacterium]
MKIESVKIFVSCPDRNFVTIKITSDEGVYGLGDATLNGRELAVATYIEEYCIPSLIGRDPFDTEDIWQYFYKGVYWRRGAVNMAAIGAIDIALWDLKAKALKVPLYQLLGGKSRQQVLTYCHAQGKTLPETMDAIRQKAELGYQAIRVQSGVPGMKSIYGIAKSSKGYEPAIKGNVPAEECWDTNKYLNFAPKLFAAVRKDFGEDLHFLHDSHHRLSPNEAARLAKELEPFHLFWMEDAVRGELQEAYRHIRKNSTTPLAIGEVFNTIYDCQTFITEQLVDYLRMSVPHTGGFTHMKKIAALAETYLVNMAPHGPSDISPIGIAANLHFSISINNFGIMEYMGHSDLTNEVFPHGYVLKEGSLYLDETPGLGVEYNEKLAEKYAYEKAFLPVNRKEDGTMFDW